jgi:hypothetical protein
MIGENLIPPLSHGERDIGFGSTAARQPPTGFQFFGLQHPFLLGGEWQVTVEHAHATTHAVPFPAARKFDTVIKENLS